MSLYPELDGLPLDTLLARFGSEDPDKVGVDTPYYMEIALRITNCGEPGIQFLLNQAENSDHVRLRAIIAALGQARSSLFDPAQLFPKYLKDSDPAIVAEAIDALRHRQIKSISASVMELRSHESPHVECAILRYISWCERRQAIPRLIDSLVSEYALVREEAVDLLDELQAKEALPYLEKMLDDRHPDVRQAVQTAIQNLRKSVNQ